MLKVSLADIQNNNISWRKKKKKSNTFFSQKYNKKKDTFYFGIRV